MLPCCRNRRGRRRRGGGLYSSVIAKSDLGFRFHALELQFRPGILPSGFARSRFALLIPARPSDHRPIHRDRLTYLKGDTAQVGAASDRDFPALTFRMADDIAPGPNVRNTMLNQYPPF